MRQRGRGLGLTLETRPAGRVVGELRADGFQRHLPAQSRVVGQVDDAHATLAEQATDLVVPEALANQRVGAGRRHQRVGIHGRLLDEGLRVRARKAAKLP